MKNHYNIEMEDISAFPIERSADYSFWEDITHEELGKALADLSENKLKQFFGVVRNGSAFNLNDYYYRIKAD